MLFYLSEPKVYINTDKILYVKQDKLTLKNEVHLESTNEKLSYRFIITDDELKALTLFWKD